jgi:esterase/lipase
MKKILFIVALLILAYFMGPSPEKPQLDRGVTWTNIPDSLPKIQSYLAEKESENPNLKPNNEGKIIWADSLNPKKTKTVFLYVHGFSASQMEGDPVHREVAKAFGANLVLARVAGHGEKSSDQVFENITADDFYESVENYYAIAKKLGDEVVVLGTSFGGALSLVLASKHPEIKALILYGPCIAVADPNATMLDNPWGKQLAKAILGSEYRDIPAKNALHDQYWSLHYKVDGIIALQNFLTHEMTEEVFKEVKCPVFLTYYYKDEEHQDNVVSVKAMKEMYPLLGTPAELKKEEAFPLSGYHVMTSPILGEHVEIPTQASIQFLKTTVQLK